MIELSVRLPLARFDLDVVASWSEPVVAIIGASGSGKSSLLEAIAGLRAASRGRIAVGGETWLEGARTVVPIEQRRLGFVPQESLLFPHLDVRGNLCFSTAKSKILGLDEVVAGLGLSSLIDRHARTLSGGERQRVAIGRALLAAPRLLLLDEPVSAIDTAERASVLAFIANVRRRLEAQLLYVTHTVAEAASLGAISWTMDQGRLAPTAADDLRERFIVAG